MAVYVEALEEWGWVIRSCRMFRDSVDLSVLHILALGIGMRQSWSQTSRVAPHYDLSASRRAAAVQLGAIEVGRREAAVI